MMEALNDVCRTFCMFLGYDAIYATVVFCLIYPLLKLRPPSAALASGLLWLVLLRLTLPINLEYSLSVRSLVDGWLAQPALDLPQVTENMGGEMFFAPMAEPVAATSRTSHFWLIPCLFWFMGAFFFGMRQTGARRRCAALLSKARRVEDPRALEMVQHWRSRLKIRRRVVLKTSSDAVAPFNMGLFHPQIFLPTGVLSNPVLTQSAIAHELAHIKRFDDLFLRIQSLLGVVYFFHPVVWICNRQLNEERERLCDALVLEQGALSRADYGKSILKVTCLGLRHPGGATAFSHSKRSLKMRVSSLGRPEKHRKLIFLCMAALGVLLLPMAAVGEPEEEGSEGSITLRNPLPQARLTSEFGDRHSPFSKKKEHHDGIDLAVEEGSRILAPADGVVRVATETYQEGEAYGTVVLLAHENGVETFYAHMKALLVKEGQKVKEGQALGTVGVTGRTTAAHLHFEVRRNGEKVDPLEWIGEVESK